MAFCGSKKNNVQAVIAYKIDRISRSADDYSQIRMKLKQYGVEIKSTSEFFENSPAGRFMENIIANVAQFDNDVRTERCIGGMKEAAREGRYVWQASYGYVNRKVGGKSNIVPSEKAPLVRMAYEQVAQNRVPVEHIYRRLVSDGLVNKQDKPLALSHFYIMLRNEVYAGWINKFGERHRGTFEPLISDMVFEQVQRVLSMKKGPKGQTAKKTP